MYFNIPIGDLSEILARTESIWTQLKGQRILITGGTGFFGRWMLASIAYANDNLDCGIQVTVMTRDPESFIANFPECEQYNFHLHRGDLRYANFPPGTFPTIIHLATDPGYLPKEEHLNIIDGTINGTRRLLDFASKQADTENFLYCSSGAIYGSTTEEQPIKENYSRAPDCTSPESLFGTTKRLTEQLCTQHASQFGLKVKIARCFSFVGPHLPLNHYAIGNFLQSALKNEDITIEGDGSPIRSYLYMSDLTVWLWQILLRGTSGTAYNVGSDQAYSIKEVAELVQSNINPTIEVDIKNKKNKYQSRSCYVPNIDKARNELGLEVNVSLTDALQRHILWEQNRAASPVAEKELKQLPKVPKKFVIDIDGVIASLTESNDYTCATPLKRNIKHINRLYDEGNYIVLFTARGYETGIDWKALTTNQMSDWGVKHHELHLGKPSATFYIDDRMLPPDALESIT